tara:strand:+ start:270 stop:1487 length:1218 start_codon:yes stop_codon:yes gene_type:complete
MASPTFVVQVYLDGSLRALTADVRAIKINVGRSRVQDVFKAGTCRISLNNQTNAYSPLGGGTYGDSQWINAEVRVNVYLNSASQPTTLFRGKIDDLDVLFPDATDSTVVLKCSDGLSTLSKTELNSVTFAEQVGSARFTAILDNAQVNYPNSSNPVDRAVDTSTIDMAGETVAGLQTATYTARLAQSEDGAIYCRHGIPGGAAAASTKRGNVMTYKKRYASSTPTGLTFIGSGGNSTQPPMTALKTTYGSEILFTRGVYAGSTGTDQVYEENVFGTPAYGVRTTVRRNLLNLNDADVLTACKNFVALHSTPALRVTQLTCLPRSMTEPQAEKVAKLGIWDGIQVSFTPVGAGTAQQRIVRIEGVTHDITPMKWTMQINTSGSGDQQFFILDSTIDGILSINKLAP